MVVITRNNALNRLRELKDKDVVKVITGVRRCGKSTLLQMFREELLNNGVKENEVVTLNFEDPMNEKYKEWHFLYEFIIEKSHDVDKLYVFLDEVQEVEEFQKVIDGLTLHKQIDIYITGSNSHLLSGELATLLTGRYIEIHLTPLSFSEYLEYGESNRQDLRLLDYLNFGGLPGSLPLYQISHNAGDDYLRSVYDTILYRDIASRLNLRNLQLFERLSSFIIDTVGSESSINSITKQLKLSGYNPSNNTVDDYLNQLKNSYVIYEVDRFDIKGKRILNTLQKKYVVDLGFKRIATFKSSISDIGHKLENAVYFELTRRFPRVYVGKVGDKEIDFICEQYDNRIYHFQVSASILDPNTFAREISPLSEITNSSGRFIITLDNNESVQNGVEIVSAHKWMRG